MQPAPIQAQWLGYPDTMGAEFMQYYLGDSTKVRKVSAKYKEKNTLFQNYNEIELAFEEEAGVLYLSTYQLKGRQKMMLSDSLGYQVKGSVVF